MPNILKFIIGFVLSGMGIALVFKLIADAHKAVKTEAKKGERIETGTQTTGSQGAYWGNNRGLRNNNPGNLRIMPNDKWTGQTGDDGAFCTFVDLEYGTRAMMKLLQNYKKKYGLDTIEKIIGRYAPINENDTAGYISKVAFWSGINPQQQLDFNAQDTLPRLAQAMCRMETGVFLPINIFQSGFLLL